jgi:hypothetical protein
MMKADFKYFLLRKFPTKLVRWHLTVSLAVFAMVNLSAKTLYISPTGKDLNPGTKEQPLGTLIAACFLSSCNQAGRQIISLNGKWEIAKTAGDLPDYYSSITTVPGLVDMATPAIDTIVPNGVHSETAAKLWYFYLKWKY